MPKLSPSELCLTIDPGSLGFADTSSLVDERLPWIGQERAEKAARFGLALRQPDYNLFVLGEVGSGRSSLMRSLMLEEAEKRPIPPDLCFINNFASPEHPLALRVNSGCGRVFKEALALLVENLQEEVPLRLGSEAFKLESDRISRAYKEYEAPAYQALARFAAERRFALRREEGRLVFTLLDEKGQLMLEDQIMVLPIEQKASLDQAEEALRNEIHLFLEAMRPEQKKMEQALSQLRIDSANPLIVEQIKLLQAKLQGSVLDQDKFDAYLAQLAAELSGNLDMFGDGVEAEDREHWFSRCKVNVVVDNSGLTCAPQLIEDNPQFRTLFGSIEYQLENEMLVTDFTRLRAGSLFRAHGGFLLLHLSDLLSDPALWERLRRFLRSGFAHIDEPAAPYSSLGAVSLEPEAVALDVKLILIGSAEQYYLLADADPEFMRHFRIKVDFAESIPATPETRHATSILIASVAQEHGLPHFSAAAVARILEDAHRQRQDQHLLSARFSYLETVVLESAALCRERGDCLVDLAHVDAALAARDWRHDYPEEQWQQMYGRGELLLSLSGMKTAQLNGLSLMEYGDHSFGFPVRVSAATFAGRDGVVNIEREVELSGPNHDKGVFILEGFLGSLFAHVAPLTLSASLVFDQEYSGVEGDSASVAEWLALLSSLSGCPLDQGLAVTGALNLHGEVLPVGGINEKIEGFFKVCQKHGLTGTQGVLIPAANRRHLMLSPEVVGAVRQGRFFIHAIGQVSEAVELMTGLAAGQLNSAGNYPPDTVFGLAQRTLAAYRRAYLASEPKRQ